METVSTDELNRRIVAALQVDPRAPWRKIARVLGESERTVTRRGGDLIESGVVQIAALRLAGPNALVRFDCAPGAAVLAAESLAQRADTIFCYLTAGRGDVVAEIAPADGDLAGILLHELPSTPGLVRTSSFPILRYFRTVTRWRISGLTDAEVAALSGTCVKETIPATARALDPRDSDVVECLIEDGRASLSTIGRRAGVSEATAARRVDELRRTQVIHIRALVEPARMGYAVEAMIWIDLPPIYIESVGRALAERPEVRYTAQVAGPHQLVANVTLPTTAALHEFLSDPAWCSEVSAVEVATVLGARKRGRRLVSAGGVPRRQ